MLNFLFIFFFKFLFDAGFAKGLSSENRPERGAKSTQITFSFPSSRDAARVTAPLPPKQTVFSSVGGKKVNDHSR